MKHTFLSYTHLVVLVLLVGSSCSNNKTTRLRDPINTGEQEPEYTWAATTDSLQDVTYTTYLSTAGNFKQDNSGRNDFNYWWNAHMLDALVDGYMRTNDAQYLPRMKLLLTGMKTVNGDKYQNDFNDDMQWMGLACLRTYSATDDPDYLAVAKELWAEVKKSWSDVYGGGITWKINTPYGKNAVSNGPATILAMRLYQIEENPDDLEWAKKLYAWEKKTLANPVTGLGWDNISQKDGKTVINKDWIFTYNQGTYIGAAIALYEKTNDKTYLNDAIKTANSTMISPKVTSEGLLRDEGQGDGGLFKGILVRYFTQLIQQPDLGENERKEYIKFLKFNAETFFEDGIGRPSMMSSPNWREKPGATTDLSTQLSGIMLIEAAAKLKEAKVF